MTKIDSMSVEELRHYLVRTRRRLKGVRRAAREFMVTERLRWIEERARVFSHGWINRNGDVSSSHELAAKLKEHVSARFENVPELFGYELKSIVARYCSPSGFYEPVSDVVKLRAFISWARVTAGYPDVRLERSDNSDSNSIVRFKDASTQLLWEAFLLGLTFIPNRKPTEESTENTTGQTAVEGESSVER